MTYAEAVSEFLFEKSIDTSPRTQEFYRNILRWFQQSTGIETLESLSPSSIVAWLVSLKSKAPATQAAYRRGLVAFARWAYRRGLLPHDPTATLPKARRTKPRNVAYYSPQDIQKLLQAAARGRTPARDTAALLVLLDTGIRAGELVNLRTHDIDWQDRVFRVDGKTGERIVPFSNKLAHSLRTYIRSHRMAPSNEQHVFTTKNGGPMRAEGVTLLVRRLALKSGITDKKLGPHTLRHTFAVSYIRAGGDAFSLQRILGHSSMDMTSVYVRMNTDDLRLAHNRFSPLRTYL